MEAVLQMHTMYVCCMQIDTINLHIPPYTFIHTYIHLYIDSYIHIYIHLYIHIHISIHIWTWTLNHYYANTRYIFIVCRHTHVYTCLLIFPSIHIANDPIIKKSFIYIYIYVYIYMYIYVHIYQLPHWYNDSSIH